MMSINHQKMVASVMHVGQLKTWAVLIQERQFVGECGGGHSA
jgi:hypothetical protein